MKIKEVITTAADVVETGVHNVKKAISDAKVKKIEKTYVDSKCKTKKVIDEAVFQAKKTGMKIKMFKLDLKKHEIDSMD